MKELIGDYEPFVANINWGLYELERQIGRIKRRLTEGK